MESDSQRGEHSLSMIHPEESIIKSPEKTYPTVQAQRSFHPGKFNPQAQNFIPEISVIFKPGEDQSSKLFNSITEDSKLKIYGDSTYTDEQSLNETFTSIKKGDLEQSFFIDTILPSTNLNDSSVNKNMQSLKPYPYQLEIFNRIKQEWDKNSNHRNQYGNIVYLETGMGKTHIAVMLLNYFFFNNKYDELKENSLDTISIIEARSDKDIQLRRLKRESMVVENKTTKKVFFIVPVQNLIEQQATIIERYTELVVGRYQGSQRRSKYYSELEAWREEFEKHDVFVAMAKKFYDLLMHGFVKMDEISIIIFDECHHTDQDHLYNLIMRDFFFHKFNDQNPNCSRPKIIGLTASPIKQKIDKSQVLNSGIESMLQNLSNNLYCRFVTFSAETLKNLENDLDMKIEKYRWNEEVIISQIDQIEAQVLKRIAFLVKLPHGTYTVNEIDRKNDFLKEQDAEVILQLLNQSTRQEAQQFDPNPYILNILKGRKTLIELNSTWTKQGIDIKMFETNEDKLLVILCLIMLKKTNNLLIELGPLAVKTFFLDLKHDLLVQSKMSSQLGEKKDETIRIIDEYCKQNFNLASYQAEDDVSSKVQKLVDIMKKSYEENKKLKTIIFVKDRSVAYYLQKLLQGNQQKLDTLHGNVNETIDQKELDESLICEGLLDRNLFKVGFALGQNNQNLVNQAYKSTNTKHFEFFTEILSGMPSCSSVKMSPTQLKETILNFKRGTINVLIATNVVEEGLDVSTCNQVICMNELTTVKAFIQMKGRARQLNSRFVFLCSEEEHGQVTEDQKNFTKVIEIMKKITLRGSISNENKDLVIEKAPHSELLPLKNICQLKEQDDTSYHEEVRTGAKISMRDAKQLIELFCQICAAHKINVQQLARPGTIPPSQQSINQSLNQTGSSNHYENKPNYVIRESQKGGVKYFVCVLYMPESCKDMLRKVNPENAFIKKKDAENHVALLAIKKLRIKGFIDDYLFPSQVITGGEPISFQSIHNTSNEESSSSFHLNSTTVILNNNSAQLSRISQLNDSMLSQQPAFDPSQPRKKKQISDDVKLLAHQKSKQFQQQIKKDKPVGEFEQAKNLVNKIQFKDNFQDLQILVFKGKTSDDDYPFRSTKDFLGFLFDRNDFCDPELVFTMFQEAKQKDKNQEHLNNLREHNLISQMFADQAQQKDEELDFVISKKYSFNFQDDLKKQGRFKSDKKYVNTQEYLTKLQFFHTWMFYYLYSADHKFLKALFKNKFPFVQHLFKKDIDAVKKKCSAIIKEVYGEKAANSHLRKSCFDNKQGLYSQYNSYGVPVRLIKDGFQVNWTLIDKVISYVRDRIQELRMPTERHIVVSKYNLEEYSKRDPVKMIDRVWDSKFQGNRHVVVDWEQSTQKWDDCLDLDKKKDEMKNFIDQFKQDMNLSQRKLQNSSFSSINSSMTMVFTKLITNNTNRDDNEFIIRPFGTGNISQNAIDKKEKNQQMTPQEYYFVKQGIFQIKRFNKYIFKCRKERHFVDFGKKRKDETISSMSFSLNTMQTERKVNTIFDLTDQMLSIAPVSYNQYQVLQSTCYQVLNLNEFLLIEKFINKFFSDNLAQWSLLQYRDPVEQNKYDLVPSDYSTKLFMTQDQIQAELGNNVLKVETKRQLQSKLALVREALTAPSACRDYDYERLEFYGDSIIGFLVILELFLLNPSNQEGDLDFFRIQQVSNENFYKINKQFKFFKYMINDPHHVFSGFMPAGLQDIEKEKMFYNYQTKITVKTFNELNNKYKEIKKMKERLKIMTESQRKYSQKENQGMIVKQYEDNNDDLTQMFLRGDFFTMAKIILKDSGLVNKFCEYFAQNHHADQSIQWVQDKDVSEFKNLLYKQDTESILKACKIMFKRNLNPLKILKMCVDVCHSKIQNQIDKQKKARDARNADNKSAALKKKKQFYYKQFADVVESVTGAVTISCGLNLTQAWLKYLAILTVDQARLHEELKKLTDLQLQKEQTLKSNFYQPLQIHEVEQIIGYNFECKTWLVQALTHKSYIDQSVEGQIKMRLDDYERLEFLGDSVLNYLVAKYFFLTTQNDEQRKMPKELHKMKTAVINNTLLSLIVIENRIHEYIIYNKKAIAFKDQFDKYVTDVNKMVKERGTTQEISVCLQKFNAQRDSSTFDLDELYDSNLKIFGDVFESIIGAVFLDCQDIDKTWVVLSGLIMPYILVYADLETLQDHARTKLLELWNQRNYTKRFKCTHESKQFAQGEEIKLTAVLINNREKNEIFSEIYKKDAKNKNRAFYKKLLMIVEKFIQQCDEKGPQEEKRLTEYPREVIEGLRKISNKLQSEEQNRRQQTQMM